MAMTAEQRSILSKMDLDAADAGDQLNEMLDGLSLKETEAALAVCHWMKDHYLKAGYKRLSKIMIAISRANS